ncbi:metalloregulator ArsR/SmtB family transcription factor [Agromyces sp. SYSU K20354]|uniref:ArsR/SmtB family transcription factor n=1 Tax=Agromyces cavernae TaxID=2898659 RepID=UPI001E28FFD7|nr:metalloregulator ArsR/SmtB family transcription factor [Agromyces cavernae]MCD2440983.1 metalloregulator ArsR/SmtB family transcription factor [Agromyces cavernae]
MASLIETIGHPGRRAMLQLVLEDELPATELAARTGMSQPTASQHLRVLREAGLVVVRVDGNRRLYRVDFSGLRRLQAELEGFWGASLSALKTAAEEEADR